MAKYYEKCDEFTLVQQDLFLTSNGSGINFSCIYLLYINPWLCGVPVGRQTLPGNVVCMAQANESQKFPMNNTNKVD